MKILHCIPSLVSGGAERQVAYLAAAQAGRGHEVDVAFVHGGPNLPRLQRSGARLHHIPSRNNHDPAILLRLIQLVRSQRPDVMQTWLTQMDVLGGIAATICGVPWVLSERSSLLSYPRTMKNWLRQRIGGRARAIIANSAGGTDYWQGRTQSRTLLCEIANLMPREEIDATQPASDDELRVTPGQKVVLVVGRLNAEKNLPRLIEALALAAAEAPFAVRICGEGVEEATLRRLIVAHGLTTRVELAGFVAQVWSWMKRADVFVSVSRFEGRPNAVLEAALCGCPLVLSDIPAHRELFDEQAARFVDADDARAIADAIVRSLVDGSPDRVARARELVTAQSGAAVEQRYHEVYRRITEARV